MARRAAFIMTFSALTPGVHAEAFTLKDTIFEDVGITSGIDPLLLYSVALAESARGFRKISPTPYVIRTESGPSYFESQIEASHALLTTLEAGEQSVDVGMMQINLAAHPHDNPTVLLSAKHNLESGAQILKTAINSTDDVVLGIGHYHHWKDESRARKYGRRVLAIYRNLKELAEEDKEM